MYAQHCTNSGKIYKAMMTRTFNLKCSKNFKTGIYIYVEILGPQIVKKITTSNQFGDITIFLKDEKLKKKKEEETLGTSNQLVQ